MLPQQQRWRGVASSRRYRMHMTQGTMMSCMLNWCFACCFLFFLPVRWGEHVLRLICQYVCVVAELGSSSPVKDFRPFFVGSVALHNVVPHFYASLVLRMGGIGVQNPELKIWHRIACSDTLCLSVSVTFSILTSFFWTASGVHPSTRCFNMRSNSATVDHQISVWGSPTSSD